MKKHLTHTGLNAGQPICGAAKEENNTCGHAVYAPLHKTEFRNQVCENCLAFWLSTFDENEEKPEWSKNLS